MDFNLTPEEEAFRKEVREFLAANLPPAEERGPGFILEWWKMVREKHFTAGGRSARSGDADPSRPRARSAGIERQAISQIAVTATSAAIAALNMSLLVSSARPRAAKLTPPPV